MLAATATRACGLLIACGLLSLFLRQCVVSHMPWYTRTSRYSYGCTLGRGREGDLANHELTRDRTYRHIDIPERSTLFYVGIPLFISSALYRHDMYIPGTGMM